MINMTTKIQRFFALFVGSIILIILYSHKDAFNNEISVSPPIGITIPFLVGFCLWLILFADKLAEREEERGRWCNPTFIIVIGWLFLLGILAMVFYFRIK
jgi:hypothetical protein